MYEYIKANWENIQSRVALAAHRAGKKPEEITVVAVSKLFPAEAIRAAVESGIADIGESRVQEAEEKIKSLGGIARWHMIGHLQSNKAKRAIELFDMIQSVDSLKLAQLINQYAADANKKIECLLEINCSGEKSKYGLEPQEVTSMIAEVSSLNNIGLSGLMTVGPLTDDDYAIRKAFASTAGLFQKGKQIAGESFRYLSMGMSSDFETAIEEGSNMVRIGTAIFGERGTT